MRSIGVFFTKSSRVAQAFVGLGEEEDVGLRGIDFRHLAQRIDFPPICPRDP